MCFINSSGTKRSRMTASLPSTLSPAPNMPFPRGIYCSQRYLTHVQTHLCLFHTDFSTLHIMFSTSAFSPNVSQRLTEISTCTFSSFCLTEQNILLHEYAIIYLTSVLFVDTELCPVWCSANQGRSKPPCPPPAPAHRGPQAAHGSHLTQPMAQVPPPP